MNKIWLLLGAILAVALLLGTWFFLVDFGGFSVFLGKKTNESIKDSPLRFIGSWDAPGDVTLTFFSSHTFQRGMDEGTWNLTNGSLSLYQYGQMQPFVRYRYEFSDNDQVLSLTDRATSRSIVYTKHSDE